ncbi:4'-phosphopantetheinyl transferase superfamily protein [Shewanella sp. UCD-KL12]|uniref:4'-phosphopantetheinyl transferase family protein n=1 Tax=Shewanella sp. UCD-KL12 TaxID=1917163 RepID=UPI0009FABDCA|nr:4'-phosphopantetheinyl transferase superfamily protein [Shewanella sp. UCD-KL12]
MSQTHSVLAHRNKNLKLFFCPLDHESLTLKQADLIKSWLPKDELTKVSRYIQRSDQEKGLMVRGFLRGLLSIVAKDNHADKQLLSPKFWRFEYGDKGKPRLTSEHVASSGLTFNISHSGEWLVIAVLSDTHSQVSELGVDIERYRQSTNIYPILNHYFTHEETQALLALPSALQRDRFFDLWALKESYIKAKGLGLALSLKSFSFDLSEMNKTKLALFEQEMCIDELEMNAGIQLNLHQGDLVKPADDWTVVLGKLNQDYRFALSVNMAANFDVHAQKMELSTLLTGVESR